MEGKAMLSTDGAVLASIGRKKVCMGFVGTDGLLQAGTIRGYDVGLLSGVTASLIGYQRDLGLANLPRRSAIAVAGLARGDSISITNTQWFLSRSGLRAMLGEPPLIINDFAAEAWALCRPDVRLGEVFGGAAMHLPLQSGCFVVVGITSGLGVAVVTRGVAGGLTVMPTEAGHGAFAASTDELAEIAAELASDRHQIIAEDIVSARGLVAIYNLLERRAGKPASVRAPEEITRSATTNQLARRACEMLAKAFWSQVSSLVMTYGAWDGVVVTGPLAHAIRASLRLPDAQALFAGTGKYQRVLRGVPRVFVSAENAELAGLAEALEHERRPAALS